MQNDSGRPFEYSYVNDSSCSYLVLEFGCGFIPLNHQVEIISQNPNLSFVPFHIRRENDQVSIYYNITSRISLSQYLERKRLNKKELLDLFRGITGSLLLHLNYMLDLSGFILDKDFIYINPATAETSLAYIPSPTGQNALEAYKAFLKDLIVNTASVDDNAKDNYIHRILNYLKSEGFNLNDFSRLIMELRNDMRQEEPMIKPVQAHKERTVSEAAACSISDARNPDRIYLGKKAESRRIFGIILLQLLVLLSVVITCLFLVSRAMGDMVSVLGVLITAAAADMLIMRKILVKRGKQEDNAERNFKNALQKPGCSKDTGSCRHGTKTPDLPRVFDTIMIPQVPLAGHPYLESAGTHPGERVIVNKDKFVIGRLGSMVDYTVQGSTVGKLHAEITENGGAYFIRDLNSKNGTYINDVKIPSNKECEIKFNDRIRFSSFEYVFKQQKEL